jgi:hypothetical protein
MISPESNPIPILDDFRSSRTASIEWGITMMHSFLDSMPEGQATPQTRELTGVGRGTAIAVRQILVDRHCLRTQYVANGISRNGVTKVWTATPLMEEVGEAYNSLVSDFMSSRSKQPSTPEQVCTRALRRLADDYGLGIPEESDGELHMLQKAAYGEQKLGHPVSLTHRALTSLAMMQGIHKPVEQDILQFVGDISGRPLRAPKPKPGMRRTG